MEIAVYLILLAIFIQDLKFRAVYWWLFVLLFVALGILVLQHGIDVPLGNLGFNLIFFFLQLVLLSLYFTIKHGKLVNITKQYLGWGDVLFLVAITAYLSFLSFVAFYILSLLLIVFFELIRAMVTKQQAHKIPLAGYQSLLLAILMIGNDCLYRFDLSNNQWLLPILNFN